jgi:DNA modification methylase
MELNKIYCENCLETMGRMSNNFIDLVVTSPPYDNIREYKGYSFDFESVAQELFRVVKIGGVVVWVVGDATTNGSETCTSFKQAIYFKEVCGFNLNDTMIYEKSTGLPCFGAKRYYQNFEYMFILSKGMPKTFNPILVKSTRSGFLDKTGNRKQDGNFDKYNGQRHKERRMFNIWRYAVGLGGTTKDKIAFQHPAIFPEKLAQDHIISWTNEGDLVYDPFMGSGTTAKMSIINNRKWIGSEISPEYCEIAEKRISQTEQLNSVIITEEKGEDNE